MRYKRIAMMVVTLLLGCGHREQLGEFKPGPMYRQWWSEVEECAHLKGQFDRVRWFKIDGPFLCHNLSPNEQCIGLWYEHVIWLSRDELNNPGTVKHEMLHDLRGDGVHDEMFGRCAVDSSP